MTANTSGSFPFLSPVWAHLTEKEIERGEGIYLFDVEGNRYIDFTSGIGVVNTGHCHPRVISAIREQSEKLLFGQMNCVIPSVALKLAEKLNEITPGNINRFFFTNSGAEATEASIKLAKSATKRQNIIVFQGSFHGRTHLAMSMTTSRTIYREGYHSLPSGIFVAPFPNSYYYGWDETATVDFCIRELNQLLHGQSSPAETAAIIIEPVLGEGGYVPCPARFLHYLRDICSKNDILLIIDEVQTGMGRTGKMFCFEHAEIIPDIIVMAKGLGSGLPISAIGSSDIIMNKWVKGSHGGTYGGGSTIPLAVACETIDIIREEGLAGNAALRGSQLKNGLLALQKKFPVIGDVRGYGLMTGVEFTNGKGEPDTVMTDKVSKSCLSRNLLMLTCGTYRNIIRWIPPLIVTEEQIKEALAIFEAALKEAAEPAA